MPQFQEDSRDYECHDRWGPADLPGMDKGINSGGLLTIDGDSPGVARMARAYDERSREINLELMWDAQK